MYDYSCHMITQHDLLLCFDPSNGCGAAAPPVEAGGGTGTAVGAVGTVGGMTPPDGPATG